MKQTLLLVAILMVAGILHGECLSDASCAAGERCLNGICFGDNSACGMFNQTCDVSGGFQCINGNCLCTAINTGCASGRKQIIKLIPKDKLKQVVARVEHPRLNWRQL